MLERLEGEELEGLDLTSGGREEAATEEIVGRVLIAVLVRRSFQPASAWRRIDEDERRRRILLIILEISA